MIAQDNPFPELSTITNFLALSPRIATGGQPLQEHFPSIQEAGYQVVINLALPTSLNALTNEGQLVAGLGMVYVHIPVLWENPRESDFDRFLAVMSAFQDYRIFIHCALNMRVSCFMFLYRVVHENCDPAAALPDLIGIWQPDETWQGFIDRILERFRHPLET